MHVAHIAFLAAAFAAPAQALEPPALCNGAVHEGWVVNHANDLPNGFVEYSSYSKDSSLGRLYLEHCASGQVMRVEFDNVWDKPATVSDHFYDRMRGAQGVSQKQLAKELKALGGQTRLSISKAESCGCHYLYPDARGDKTPFEGAQ